MWNTADIGHHVRLSRGGNLSTCPRSSGEGHSTEALVAVRTVASGGCTRDSALISRSGWTGPPQLFEDLTRFSAALIPLSPLLSAPQANSLRTPLSSAITQGDSCGIFAILQSLGSQFPEFGRRSLLADVMCRATHFLARDLFSLSNATFCRRPLLFRVRPSRSNASMAFTSSRPLARNSPIRCCTTVSSNFSPRGNSEISTCRRSSLLRVLRTRPRCSNRSTNSTAL